jgi:hypothetical protein
VVQAMAGGSSGQNPVSSLGFLTGKDVGEVEGLTGTRFVLSNRERNAGS